MKTFLIWLGVSILVIGTGICVAFSLRSGSLIMEKTFAPAEEQVRREVFEQSKAYNQGMIQEIQNMQFEYIKASESQKEALASIILHRVADYDVAKMPQDTREFIKSLKENGSK